jgi:hypothetical protein
MFEVIGEDTFSKRVSSVENTNFKQTFQIYHYQQT